MRTQLLLSLALSASPAALPAQAQLPEYNIDGKGVWLGGYDPVAYFTQHKAVLGDTRYSHGHQGATFRFSSPANRDLFMKAPERYLPQYGGWCAFAMGDYGKKVEVDPETFKVKGGKLFLFYNALFNNTLTSWNKDEARLLPAADRNWATFKHKP